MNEGCTCRQCGQTTKTGFCEFCATHAPQTRQILRESPKSTGAKERTRGRTDSPPGAIRINQINVYHLTPSM